MKNWRDERRNRIMFLLFVIFAIIYVYAGVLLFGGSGNKFLDIPVAVEPVTEQETETETETAPETETELITETDELTETEKITEKPLVERYEDPDNYMYPYCSMSSDFGSEVYEEGFRYLHIPEEFVKDGGVFPEVVQVYLWCQCKERDLDYYTIVALIERESRYRYGAKGDGGNSKGYMQIQERWHWDRMQEENVEDLYDPYGNLRVGLNFLDELYEKYGSMSKALMAYNMGEDGAKDLWDQGITSTKYSQGIQDRAQELRQELQG